LGRAVLIVGMLPHDSGKTTFALMLAEALREEGFRVKAMKPVAAHSAWFQPWSLAESYRLGVLVGGDVVRYLRSGLIENPDLQNPVDLLTAPPDPIALPTTSTYMSSVEALERQVVAARLSIHGRAYYVVPDNLARTPPHLRAALEGLLSRMGPASKATPQWLLLRLSSPEVSARILDAARSLMRSADVLLIESFNNALTPAPGIESIVSSVIAVAPGRALVYRGGKLRAYLSGSPAGVRSLTHNFAALARPDATLSIPLTGPGAGGGRFSVNERLIEILLGVR